MWTLAHAKINLSLEVLGLRADGYHQVETIIHAVDLADRLSFAPSASLSLECSALPALAERNLAMRAARLLQHETGCTNGAAMVLEKHIPIGSGLGGGSSDAAAVLKALDTLWELKLSPTMLMELAASLGSDVPYFLWGGCALAEGRGEVITPIPSMISWWAVLIPTVFNLSDKTSHLYGLLEEDDFTDGSNTRDLAQSLRDGTALNRVIGEVANVFERVALLEFTGLGRQREALLDAGAPFVRLTGSGPTLYTLVDNWHSGKAIFRRLKDCGYEAYLVRLLGPGESSTPPL